MNKSKFLKKSLAMLLALMLVLAMIPLSASAAAEDHIDVLLVNGKQVARNGDNLSVTVGNTTVSLDAVVKDGVDLYYVDSDGQEQPIDLENGTTDIELTDGYATDVENQYAMNIIAKVKENAATDDEETEYTYPLTITVDVAAASTDTSLAGLAEGNPAWNDMVDYTIDNVTHNITVTLGFGKDKPINNEFNHSGLDFEPTADGASVTYHDPENITVVSPNGDTQDYTIKYVNEPGFLTFTVPDQVGESKITSSGFDDSTVEINVPYGYDTTKFIPTFTTSEKIQKVTVERGTTPVISDSSELNAANRLILWYGTGDSDYGVVTIKLNVPPQNPEGVLNDITVATGSTAAESSAKTEITGSTTFVEMPADTNIATATYNVTVNFSKGATVTLTDANGEDKYDDSTGMAGTYKFTGVEVIGEGHSFVIKVVSEDTKMTNTYTIQLGKASSAAAELTNFVFKDPDTNKEYKAVWNGTEGTITMPYAYRASGAMDNVRFFFKTSAGATLYFVDGATDREMYPNVLTNTTVGTGTYKAYFPGFDKTFTYKVVASDGTTKTYTITLKTDPARTGREVNSIDFAGEDQTWKITESNTYSAEIGKATLDGNQVNTIKITVPYSWKGKAVYLYNLGISEGAKMYAYNGGWKAVAGVNEAGALSYKTGLTTNELDAVDAKGVLDADKAIQVVVLSEKEAVLAGDSFASIKNKYVDGDNATFYYIYAEKAPAETGSELLSIESTTDPNVTATLNGTTVTIAVPNSYATKSTKFSLNLETSKLAKTYMDNGNGEPNTDWQIFSDLGSVDTEGRTMFRVQTIAGKNELAAFVDDPVTAHQVTTNGNGKIYVKSEQGDSTHAYDVKLVVNDAETGASITALSVNGTAATIAGDKINVRLPLGTKLYPVTLDITASKMADVQVGTTGGYDPEGRYDLNDEIKITVKSEDTKTTKTYTLSAVVADSFNDVPTSEWYYDEVMTAANAGWINGTKPGYFEPNGTMTRGDFAVIIARILGCDTEATVESKFPDCNETDYFNAAVTFCKLRGIIDGDDKGYFNPYDAITREEMAKILCNALELDELETSANPFEDDAEIAQWAKGYVNAVQAEGIMEGSNGSFNPRDNATRAEGAAVLVRAFA